MSLVATKIVDEDSKFLKISITKDTSVSLGTTHQQNVGLRAAEYLPQNFCCAIRTPGGPRGGVKNYFCLKRVKMQ